VYDLRFSCRYQVKGASVCENGQTGPAAHLTIEMPSCSDVAIRGSVAPDCPTRCKCRQFGEYNLKENVMSMYINKLSCRIDLVVF